MASTIPSTALVPLAPVFTNTEQLALAGYLAGYSGLTRQAYELDLRQFASWCQQHQLRLFGARGWIMSPTPLALTVTSSALCWSRPGLARRRNMP